VEAQKGSSMKAVAVALVLVIGAAVVLWYGNTLNSWVLGGLIGGLAALLISIPISLTLFSYLSKQHDERLQVEEQEEIALAREEYNYLSVPARLPRRPREVEGYVIADETSENALRDKEIYAPRQPRALPAPAQQRRESANQDQGSRSSGRLPVPQQGTYSSTQRGQQAQPKGKETTVLRATTKKINVPGYESTPSLSHHRSEALRTARLEAAKQRQDDEVEASRTNNPKRGLSVRPNQALAKQNEHNTSIRPSRPSRQLPQQPANQPRPARRIVDSKPSQHSEHRSLPFEDEQVKTSPQRAEPRTGYTSHQLPQTGPVRRSSQAGQASRSTQEHEGQYSEGDDTTGSVNRPLVRRAPYMYEDDPMRQEFAEHLDAPAVRRSSRFDENGEDE